MTKTFITQKAKETEGAGGWLARRIQGGQVLCLSGDLSGGKTTFVKGLAREFGVGKTITSPTFVVQAVYPVKNKKAKDLGGRFAKSGTKRGWDVKRIYHFDVYRVKDSAEILALGWEEVLADPHGLVVVEWGERIKDILPPRCLWVRFRFIDADTREIKMEL